MSVKLTNEEAIRYLKAIKEDGFGLCEEEKEATIDMAISALKDARPKGKWESEVDYGNVEHVYCSECRKEGRGTIFCPNCGADMREDGVDATEN